MLDGFDAIGPDAYVVDLLDEHEASKLALTERKEQGASISASQLGKLMRGVLKPSTAEGDTSNRIVSTASLDKFCKVERRPSGGDLTRFLSERTLDALHSMLLSPTCPNSLQIFSIKFYEAEGKDQTERPAACLHKCWRWRSCPEASPDYVRSLAAQIDAPPLVSQWLMRTAEVLAADPSTVPSFGIGRGDSGVSKLYIMKGGTSTQEAPSTSSICL